MKHSAWLAFIEDFGDCVGGILIGYGLRPLDMSTIVFGGIFIAASLFLKHYNKPKPN